MREDVGALSRVDNTTEICSRCGSEEAERVHAGLEPQPRSSWAIKTSKLKVSGHDASLAKWLPALIGWIASLLAAIPMSVVGGLLVLRLGLSYAAWYPGDPSGDEPLTGAVLPLLIILTVAIGLDVSVGILATAHTSVAPQTESKWALSRRFTRTVMRDG